MLRTPPVDDFEHRRLRDACAPVLDTREHRMETVEYYLEKGRQCRRLARSTNDQRVTEGLTALAEEFEAKAKAAQASGRTVDLLGDGKPGRLISGDDTDPA